MIPTLLESAATPRLRKTHTCSRTRTTPRPSCLWICGETGGSNGGRPLCTKCSGSAKTSATTVYSPYGLGIKIIPDPKNTFKCKAERVPYIDKLSTFCSNFFKKYYVYKEQAYLAALKAANRLSQSNTIPDKTT